MSSTILLLLLMGIFGQANGYSCDTSRNKEAPCCDGPRDLSCAYKSPAELVVGDKCYCRPREIDDASEGKLCGFAPAREQLLYDSTQNRTSIPCLAGYRACPPVIEMVDIRCYYGYPWQAEVLNFNIYRYCGYTEKVDGKKVFASDELIYDTYLTCWLYPCGNRLEKTKLTTDWSDKLQWCFPPVLPGDPKAPEFCPKYVHNENIAIYKAMPFNPNSSTVAATVKSGSTEQGCVLPPICEQDGTLNRRRYMLPWYDGKANEKHCEVLCDMKGPNNGKLNQNSEKANLEENKCRRRPSCGDEEKYNRFQITDYKTNCRPWCSPDSDDNLKKENPNGQCNTLPLCKMVDGKYSNRPEEPYSEKNPYGSEEKCITPTACKAAETPETHHCLVDQPSNNTHEDPSMAAERSNSAHEGGFPFICVLLGFGLFVLLDPRTVEKA